MEEKKLTDKEMDCLNDIYISDCETCHLFDEPCPLFDEDCNTILPKALKELIHRLQIENVTLKTELRKECEEHEEFTKKAKEEIERLTERLDYFQKSSDYHEGNQKELEAKNAELQKQVDELTEERENMQDVILGLEDKLANVLLGIKADEVLIAKGVEQAVKDTAKKFADLVEFHSIARMNDGVEYFTISALGLKEILVEEFGFKYSELNGVEVE